jgi:putative Ig domain-containing protein
MKLGAALLALIVAFAIVGCTGVVSRNSSSLVSDNSAFPQIVKVANSSLPGGQVQAPYSATLAATGGTQPYSWSMVAGSLPPGLTLGASTGVITGMPNVSGQYSFTVQVTDPGPSILSARQTFTISIAAAGASPSTPAVGGVFCGASNFGVSLPNCDPNSPNANTVFDTTMPDTSNYTVVNVGSGGDLQTAINNASCNPNGTIVSVAAGATFNSGFGSPVDANAYVLPNKTCAAGQWIIIQSSAIASLPPPGTRVDYTIASNMPNIQAVGGGAAIRSNLNANHYRLIGLQVSVPSPSVDTFELIDFDPSDNTSPPVYGQGSSYIVVDRCYVHGNSDFSAHQYTHGIVDNGNFMAVLDSYISNFHDTGNDAQSILVWTGSIFKWNDNYLAASGENVMSGGVVTGGSPPSDFEVRGNHMFKPTAWKGVVSDVKNLFEIKNGVRVLVDGNVLENTWLAGQNGFAILWNLSPGDSASPETLAQETDITFTHNIVRHAANGMTIANNGGGGPGPSNLLFQNNVFQDINDTTWGDGTQGWWLQQSIVGGGTVIDHNTILEVGSSGGAFVAFCSNGVGGTIAPWQATNNLVNYAALGVYDCDRGLGSGNPAINSYIPTATLGQNVFINSMNLSSIYPSGFLWAVPDGTAVGFTDNTNCVGGTFTASACALTSGGLYHNAGTDGADIGANIASILAATANAVQSNDGQ